MSSYFNHSKEPLQYVLSLIPDLKEFCAPLFANSDIKSFGYIRIYNDGHVLNLTTEEKWILHRFDKQIKYKILFDHYNKPYIFLWPNDIYDPLLSALYDFDIWNGCNIYILFENYVEIFSFASSKNNTNMQNFYINNIDLLNTFIVFFKERLNSSINILDKDKFLKTDIIFPDIKLDHFENPEKKLTRIYESIQLKRVHFSPGFALTMRELECCYHWMNGNSAKVIGKKLNLSPRTVESYLTNAKLKTSTSEDRDIDTLVENNRWIFNSVKNITSL
jgi:LuxR family quorum-sensing system transcriptional regulator SolR